MSDHEIRLAVFDWLSEQVELHGDVLSREVLARGLKHKGERIRLVGPQGIFKPRAMRLPLSIFSSLAGPYDDGFGPDGLLRYKYRGTDPEHHENRGLREAMRRDIPLVYLHAIAKGKYVAVWPVYIVGDNPTALTFSVAVDDAQLAASWVTRMSDETDVAEYDSTSRRRYVTRLVRQRLHQRTFRERVLHAYREQCALCRIRHSELLDAAHIIPDAEELGEPRVSNGLSLCKLHHAAFDRFFLAIRPDYTVEVQPGILAETDGPMLLHGLQGVHGHSILLPRRATLRPDPALLAKRYERFLAAPGR